MTSRQAGKRISELSRRRKPSGPRPSVQGKRQAPPTPAEKRRMTQLVICAAVFVLLVGVKLLLPGKLDRVRESVSGVMDRNMDVTEVFSAVGRAISGERSVQDSLGDVYQAVFHPAEAVETAAPADGAADPSAAMESLRAFADGTGSADGWLPDDGESTSGGAGADTSASAKILNVGGEPETASPGGTGTADQGSGGPSQTEHLELSYVTYSGENLPDNVSMEQAVLGFDYCTPVCGTLTSGFGYRIHPIEGEEDFHHGVDIAADTGTAILCFADGTVTAVGESSSYGKYCIIRHNNGFSTLYAHCSKVTASSGVPVKEGQKIAEVGETGMATGPHLHFELHEEGVYLNPIYYVTLV